MINAPQAPWPARAVALAVLGTLAGAIVARLADHPSPAGGAAMCGLIAAALVFGLVWDRGRLGLALAMAGLAGLVVGAAGWWAGLVTALSGLHGLRLACGVVAVAVAVPLVQAWADTAGAGSGWRRLPAYAAAHDRAWTGLVTLLAALAFALMAFLTIALLGELFRLIGIGLLADALENRNATLPLLAGALGGGGGLARDQAAILSTLQRVLRFILSALTPVLAIGLALFLGLLPFTGLEPLWAATRNTTPILIACIAAALVLANAVIADEAGQESRRRPLRAAAMLLLACMAPLAIIAAVSAARRVAQHGWTPDRLWAAVIIALALAYGLAGLWALARPQHWMARARAGNLAMAMLLAGCALLLATPLADFGAMAAHSQLARLQSGAIATAKFDWVALRHDFGPAGVAAVRQLARSADPAIAADARQALAMVDRWDLERQRRARREAAALARNLFVLPRGGDGRPRAVPAGIRTILIDEHGCAMAEALCVLHWPPGATQALAFVNIAQTHSAFAVRLRLGPRGWQTAADPASAAMTDAAWAAWRAKTRAALAAGRVEIRPAPGELLVIDGQVHGAADPVY